MKKNEKRLKQTIWSKEKLTPTFNKQQIDIIFFLKLKDYLQTLSLNFKLISQDCFIYQLFYEIKMKQIVVMCS